MKEIKAYQCSYCSFYRKTKKIVKTHEDNCFYNPKNRACASCEHNTIEFTTIYNPDNGGNPGSTDYEAPFNWCEVKEIELNDKTLCKDCPMWESKKDE